MVIQLARNFPYSGWRAKCIEADNGWWEYGDEDETVSVADAYGLSEAHGGDNARLEIVSGGSHTFGVRHPFSGSTDALRMAMDSTITWLTRHMQ